MVFPIVGLVAIFCLILISEGLWRFKVVKAETSRKIVHIGVGTFVAVWPFFTTFRAVQILAAAFFLVILLSRIFHIFKGIHSVRRQTWGELFYPIGIGLASILTTNKYVFAAAILHLSLADGLAAIVGLKYGRKQQYHVDEQTKSYIGTITFCAISAIIIAWVLLSPESGLTMAQWPLLLIVPTVTAFTENIAPFGSDNMFIPLMVIALLDLGLLWS